MANRTDQWQIARFDRVRIADFAARNSE